MKKGEAEAVTTRANFESVFLQWMTPVHLNHPFVSIPADACVILSPRSVVEPSELHMLPPRSRKTLHSRRAA